MTGQFYHEEQECRTPQKRIDSFARMNIVLNIPLIILKILTIIFILSHGKYGLGDGIFMGLDENPEVAAFKPSILDNSQKLNKIFMFGNSENYYVRLFYEIFWLGTLVTDFVGSILLLYWSKTRNVSALGVWLIITCILIAACFPLGINSILYNGFPETDVILFLSTYAWDLFGLYCVYTARRSFKRSMMGKENLDNGSIYG